MRVRGMHDLSDVATVLYFVKINSVVLSTITFVAQACATLAPYTKDMAAGSIRLGGVLLGQFLGLLQMFCSGLFKTPLLSYIPLRKLPPLDKIFIALIKGELNNSSHVSTPAALPCMTRQLEFAAPCE